MILGFQKYDFAIVTENSNRLASEWSNIRRFLSNLLQEIDNKRRIPDEATVALFVYSSVSTQVLPHAKSFDRTSGSYFINNDLNAHGSDAGTEGIVAALSAVCEHLREPIKKRLDGETTDAQAVIVFVHSAVDNEPVAEVVAILKWFMDAGVHVIVCGKKLQHFVEILVVRGVNRKATVIFFDP